MFLEAASQTDTCASLLAEVDFKWLMAGQGLRIDLPRFRSDAVYAAKLLSLALDSESFALRDCVAANALGHLSDISNSPTRKLMAKIGNLPKFNRLPSLGLLNLIHWNFQHSYVFELRDSLYCCFSQASLIYDDLS
jgi:hypothetical protein